jgi:enoyl-CoA hydratase/carnithine racemase
VECSVLFGVVLVPIRRRSSGHVSWVIIDREEKGNSLDYDHAVELAAALEESCRREESTVVALRGAGERFFSTGVDLDWIATLSGAEGAASLVYHAFSRLTRAVLECGKPMVAAINGHAVGIAFELVQLADLAVAVKGAKLGVPAVRWGMVPPISTTLTPILHSYKVAGYLALTGRLVTAEEAERMGLVNVVVESVGELEEWVEELASDLSRLDPWALAQARAMLRRSLAASLIESGLQALAISATRPETARRAASFSKRKKRGKTGK